MQSLMYIPFAKVRENEDGTVTVIGIATDETPDEQKEIVDFEASKKAFGEWERWGNIRAMHDPSRASGRALSWEADEENRRITLEAKVIDPVDVLKVREGVYKGFSVGGRKKEWRRDGEYTRITDYDLIEVSLVDRPANPSAVFTVVKRAEEPEKGGEVMEKADKSEREKLREEAEQRAKRYGISFKEGKGHLTPPKGYPEDPEDYGDPVNYAYPIDEEHIRPAVSYFNHEGQREAGGYTTEEWAIIGRRIAERASKLIGPGYKYEGGKIVREEKDQEKVQKATATLANNAVLAKQGDDGAGPSTPGSQQWEQVDAQMLTQAVQGVVALKDLVRRILEREQAEWFVSDVPHDETEIPNLYDALEHLGEALRSLAASAFTEAIEAQEGGHLEQSAKGGDLAKAGRTLSKANQDRVHKAMSALAEVCKCDACTGFMKAISPDQSDGKEKPEANSGEEAKDADKGEDMNKALGVDPGANFFEVVSASIAKAIEASGLSKAAESIARVQETIAKLEQRVTEIENQPLPGGPFLRGAAPVAQQDYWLVRKGSGLDVGEAVQSETSVLEKVMQNTSDPYVRDFLSREIAKRLHPTRSGQ